VIDTEEVVMPDVVRAEIAGGVTSTGPPVAVVNEYCDDVAVLPDQSFDSTM
jgi:hypothetical protein